MAFPKEVKIAVGYALSEAQKGRKASYANPLKGLGPGVLEIVADHNTDTYRSVYAVKLADDILVLHAFKKKSKSGSATPKSEIDLVKSRLKQVQAQLRRKT
uniref:type II toxin-antitoxin system RelE/ParE family toxin n=1 Tax=Pararhizobium sp. IMCC3301 TaxID=3067904 RepID=UPI0027414478|nr:type II toxin-antitoxin system RelE/ParE family toxin [Pararhizobium sp. IMCC3301]